MRDAEGLCQVCALCKNPFSGGDLPTHFLSIASFFIVEMLKKVWKRKKRVSDAYSGKKKRIPEKYFQGNFFLVNDFDILF